MARIHFVPHTHWDREWYLPFQVFRIKLIHLMDRLLDLLSDDEKFTHFMLDGQAIILDDYLEVRPEKFPKIQSFVQSERLQIGPWYVLPDEFLVSPEALIRNLLHGGKVCGRFGDAMRVGYVPDPFGHISQLPQILNGFGISYAALRRGLSDEPVELYWDSGAGSRVLLSYLRDGYENAARAPEDPKAFQEFIRTTCESLLPYSQSSQILLLNGTDHHEPQRQIPALIESSSPGEHELILSNLERYFEALEFEINQGTLDPPIISGELRNPKRHHLLPGTLSSRVWIKQRNHECETLIERWVEPFTTWAALYSSELPDKHLWTGHLETPFLMKPAGVVKEAWRLLLSCQPHDSICGCSIDQVHEEMQTRFDMVEQICLELARGALTVLADRVDSSSFRLYGCLAALVVFNAASSKKTGRATAKLELQSGLDPFEIVDSDGQTIPYRILKREARSLADLELDTEGLLGMLAFVDHGSVMGLAIQDISILEGPDQTLIDVTVAENAPANKELVDSLLPDLHTRIMENGQESYRLIARFATKAEIEFLAENVPPLGYLTYGLRPASVRPDSESPSHKRTIKNDSIELKLQSDGSLILHDLRNGEVYSGLGRLQDRADRGDSYTFCPLEEDPGEILKCKVEWVECKNHAIGSTLTYYLSSDLPEGLTSNCDKRLDSKVAHFALFEVTLSPGLPIAYLTIQLTNKARDHRLQLLFPSGISTNTADYDGHFELITRTTDVTSGGPDWAEQPVMEQPMRRFVAVHNESRGIMIANRGLREASVNQAGEIALTLLRSFGWLSRDDLSTRSGAAGPSIPTPGGQGIGEHTYQLAMIPYASDYFEAVDLADQFQTTMTAVATSRQTGEAPQRVSLVSTDQAEFQITAIKTAEDGEGIIMRGVNLADHPIDLSITFGIPFQSLKRCRLDETDLEQIELQQASRVDLVLADGEILTLKGIPQQVVQS